MTNYEKIIGIISLIIIFGVMPNLLFDEQTEQIEEWNTKIGIESIITDKFIEYNFFGLIPTCYFNVTNPNGNFTIEVYSDYDKYEIGENYTPILHIKSHW